MLWRWEGRGLDNSLPAIALRLQVSKSRGGAPGSWSTHLDQAATSEARIYLFWDGQMDGWISGWATRQMHEGRGWMAAPFMRVDKSFRFSRPDYCGMVAFNTCRLPSSRLVVSAVYSPSCSQAKTALWSLADFSILRRALPSLGLKMRTGPGLMTNACGVSSSLG